MNAIDCIRRLHQHRNWVNENLLAAAEALTEEELKRPLPIGQGSVWKTLLHLMGAEYVWLGALEGNETAAMPGDAPGKLPGNQEGEDAMLSLADLASTWRRLAERWDGYLESLDEASLDDIVYRVSTSIGAGKRWGTRRGDILLHVCTHAQYTTAQCVNMLRQLGKTEFPNVMLIALARLETTDG